MGKYDDITPDRLRTEMLRFARLILKMEEEGVLLEKTPTVLRLLGELRQMLFAHEVRYTQRLLPTERRDEPSPPATDPAMEESMRIVEEAMKREKELQRELEQRILRDRRADDD